MSGGYLEDGLGKGEHKVIIFTFKGPITPAEALKWDDFVATIKSKQWLGDRVMAVTLIGEKTPLDRVLKPAALSDQPMEVEKPRKPKKPKKPK
jgi:hypothetical protein